MCLQLISNKVTNGKFDRNHDEMNDTMKYDVQMMITDMKRKKKQ